MVDPWGHVIAEAPTDQECLLIAEVDLAVGVRARETFPVLKDKKM